MNLRSPLWSRLLLALAASALMIFCAYSTLHCAYWEGQYSPAHADAFYHARRILDAVMSGQPVIQFDPRIHVPEGSWLVWPWGFDQALAWITSWFGPFTSEQDAARVLFHLPPAFIPVAIGLMVWLTWQFRLSLGMSTLAVLSYAAVPLMSFQYSVGNVDHHFAEQLWVLLLLNAVVWLLRCPVSRAAPVFLGTVLGAGVAIQNGLFLLPVALVLALAVPWLRRLPLPQRARMDALAATLLLVTLAACVPSQLWRKGEFSFYVLSWFHVYVAAICGAYIVWMARATPSWRSAGLMVAAGVAALALIYPIVAQGMQFASGEFDAIRDMAEAKSPYRIFVESGPQGSTFQLTWLMWFAAPAMLLCAWWASRNTSSARVAFAVIGVVLLALLQSQVRFAVMGMMPLVIALPLAAEDLAVRRPDHARIVRLLIALGMAVCFVPIKGWFHNNWMPGNDYSYMALRRQWQPLAEACTANSGTVLAPKEAGHWITYHTNCSVLANVFILTPQQLAKIQEVNELMSLDPGQLRATRPDIRYVLAYAFVARAPRSGAGEPTDADIQSILPDEAPLVRELLRNDRPAPAGYRQVSFAATNTGGVYARTFEIER